MKQCKYCHKKYPENQFGIAKTTSTKIYRRQKCNICYAITKRKNRHKKSHWLVEYKKTLKCSNCSYNDYRGLDFHHPNGDKEIDIGTSISRRSIENTKKEIDKCIVLCACCHRELHYDERYGI